MKIYIIALLLLIVKCAYSQPFIWGKHWGGWNDDYPIDLEKVDDGIILTRTGSAYQSHLYRLDTEGNMVWEFNFMDDKQFDLLTTCVDPNENIYTIMSRDGNYEPDTIDGIIIYPGISLLKIDKNGKTLWSKKIGGAYVGNNLFYFNGNIYVTGIFSGIINIDNQKELTSQEYYQCYMWMYMKGADFYCAKFDTTGVFVDAISFGEDYPDYIAASTMNTQTGDIYITGGSDFHPCTTSYTTLIKIKPNLTIDYTQPICREEDGYGLFYPANIYFSSNNHVYIWGYNYYDVKNDNLQLASDNNDRMANLLEFNAEDGSFIKAKQFATKTSNYLWGFGGYLGTIENNKAYLTDYGKDSLLVFASSRNKIEFDKGTYTPTNETSKYNETLNNENLLLFTINKETFNTNYITSIKGANVGKEYNLNNPGPVILDSCFLTFSAAYTENPIEIFRHPIQNNSGNGATDVLLAQIDISQIPPESSHSGITPDEYQALVEFYNESGGSNWNHNENWLDTINSIVDNWYGISVSEGHVYSIVLANNNLTQVSESLAHLPYLKKVILCNGGFSGDFPNLSQQDSLNELDLSSNSYYYQDLIKITKWDNFDQIYFSYSPQSVRDTAYINLTTQIGDTIVLSVPDSLSDPHDYAYSWWPDCENPNRFSSSDATYLVQGAKQWDNGTYTLVVKNTDLDNIPRITLIIKLTVEIPTAFNETPKGDTKLLPNPTSGNLSVLSSDQITQIRVYNTNGQLLISRSNNLMNTIDLTNLKNGTYILQIELKDHKTPFIERIILQK